MYKIAGTTCFLCGESVENTADLFRIPIFDDRKLAKDSSEVAKLATYTQRLTHRFCWQNCEDYKLICSLIISSLEIELEPSFCLARGEEVGAWTRDNPDISLSPGAIFLPGSSYLFQNLCRIDIRSGVIRTRSKFLRLFIYLLLTGNDRALCGNTKEDKAYVKILEREAIGDVLKLDIKSSKRGLEGTYFIAQSDINLLQKALTIPVEELIY